MPSKQIKKFVQESIKEVREALPDGFRVDDKIHFDISVVTESKARGGLDIKIANLGSDLAAKNIHKIRFSIIDEKAQAKAWKKGESMMRKFIMSLAQLEQDPSLSEVETSKRK